ncbi:SDR family NAD(P)-dependent oxidoreductase [Spirosoma fluminis]
MATVLVTGAAGGLGRVVTRKLLSSGHRVIATRQPGSDPHRLSDQGPGELITYQVDLTDAGQTESMIKQVIAEKGPVDCAVLLAGGFTIGSLAETDSTQLDHMLTLNFKTAYHVVQPLFAYMTEQQQSGRFLLVGGRPALDAKAGKNMVAYALSKSLLLELSALINASGQAQDIVSTVLVPSTIDTSANREAMPQADFTSWVTPDDLADIITYVLFDKGRVLREPVLKVYNRA